VWSLFYGYVQKGNYWLGNQMKRTLVLLSVIITGLILTACSNKTVEMGLLQGIVTIGPLSPVENSDERPPVPCEVYEARKIMVYDESGRNLLHQVDIDCDGRYRVELKPGTYTIDINHIGIDTSGDVPKQVEIMPGITFKLDIDIDTGIR
jgi:hypothetical protein